jgi:hypothetical protein
MPQAFLGPAVPGIYDDLVNGTCELGQGYGTVISGELDYPEDLQEIVGCDGRVSAVLVRDEKIGYSFQTIFPTGITLPKRGDNIAFPALAGAGIGGQIVSVKVNWTQGGQRGLSVVARRWEQIGTTPTRTAIA